MQARKEIRARRAAAAKNVIGSVGLTEKMRLAKTRPSANAPATPSATPTATGFMSGRYQMISIRSGEPFEIDVPTFSLDSPDSKRVLN